MRFEAIQDIDEALPTLFEHDRQNQQINFPKDQPLKDRFEQNIREWYTKQPDGFFFVYEGDELIGSLLLRVRENPFRNQTYGEIWYIYLDATKRGQGYGTNMISFADTFFQQKGCAYGFAGVSALNPASNALFANAGYTTTRLILEKDYENRDSN